MSDIRIQESGDPDILQTSKGRLGASRALQGGIRWVFRLFLNREVRCESEVRKREKIIVH
ncbi:MAG: hypothetical protein EB088_14030 [Betaproteobacteria bacterium]|nr:hypothetical protein [Betaproteobacteria bacterium]NDC86727.1 hypothetical protein [Betaproteobacteria bacterium]